MDRPVFAIASHGLVMVGTFRGIERNEAGAQVVLEWETGQGSPFRRTVLCELQDFESGEPTKLASDLGLVSMGDRVALRVTPKVAKSGKSTWLLATGLEVLPPVDIA